MVKSLITTIFKVIALAMSIAIVTMSAIGALVQITVDLLFGVGLAELAAVPLQKAE